MDALVHLSLIELAGYSLIGLWAWFTLHLLGEENRPATALTGDDRRPGAHRKGRNSMRKLALAAIGVAILALAAAYLESGPHEDDSCARIGEERVVRGITLVCAGAADARWIRTDIVPEGAVGGKGRVYGSLRPPIRDTRRRERRPGPDTGRALDVVPVLQLPVAATRRPVRRTPCA